MVTKEELVKTPMTEEEQELILANQKLIWKRVHALHGINRRFDKSDLFNEGVFGAIKAIRSYNPSKGKFSVHLYRGIDGAIRGAIRLRRYEFVSSLNAAIGDEDDENLSIGNSIILSSIDSNRDAFVDCHTKIFPIMDKVLEPHEIIVIKCFYDIDGYHIQYQEDILDFLWDELEYECSLANLRHIEKRGLKKLREAIKE